MATGTRPHVRAPTRDELPARHRPGPVRAFAIVLAAAALAGCVTQDADSGEYVPRGNQRFELSKVEMAAEKLRDGMTKAQVLLLLDSAGPIVLGTKF
jgi:hypothetical protein